MAGFPAPGAIRATILPRRRDVSGQMIGGSPTRTRDRTLRRRLLAGAGALAGHALVLAIVLASYGRSPPQFAQPPIITPVTLVEPLPPPARPAARPAVPAGPKRPAPPKRVAARPPPVPQRIVRPLAPTVVPRLVVQSPPEPPAEAPVSAQALATATTADSEAAGGDGRGGEGSGGGLGGRCDMVRRLQKALRKDAGVQAAVAGAHRAPGFAGRPLMVWNGDWIRHGEEEGKGLAGVRQAIAVEVAFAPSNCRSQAMRGLVVLSLNDAPGAPRLVLGAGAWRWSDLTVAR